VRYKFLAVGAGWSEVVTSRRTAKLSILGFSRQAHGKKGEREKKVAFRVAGQRRGTHQRLRVNALS